MMFKKALIIGMIVGMLGWLLTSGVQAASPPRQGEGQPYVVQADDSLSQLAEKYLGDANLWPRIVEATNTRAAADPRLAVIDNPNVIYPGQIVFIPTVSPTLPGGVEPGEARISLDILCQDQHPAVQAFCSEIPIARIHFDPYEEVEFFTCASRSGLGSVQLDPNEVTILVPNDGDFDLRGITASLKVTPDRASLIPRWPGSKFDFSAEYAQKFELPVGEQLEIPLSQAFELVKAGELIWTGQHGVPGKAGLFQTNPILTCDPQADFDIELGPFKPKG
jgi:LysM repeat protein